MTDIDMSIEAKSDQLNADDLMDGPRTITITKVTGQPDVKEQPVSIHYEGDGGKPYKPCKTMRRLMVGAWGKYTSKYAGRSMTLFRDAAVSFGGMQVGGIRISHMSDIDEKKTVALMVTRGRKAPFTILPLIKNAPSAERDAATTWAEGFIAKLANFTELAAVDGFENEKSAKLAELKTARPDLHSRVVEAITQRKEALGIASTDFDDDEFGSGPTDEPDSNTNDAATDEPTDERTPAEEAVEKVIAQADAAKTTAALDKIIKEAEPHVPFMPPELGARLEIAFDRNRRRLEPQPEPAK